MSRLPWALFTKAFYLVCRGMHFVFNIWWRGENFLASRYNGIDGRVKDIE